MTDYITQRTLDGGELLVDDMPERSTTLVTCPTCETIMFIGERHDHPHDVFAEPDDGDNEDEDEDEDDWPDNLGAWYDVTLEYSVTYRFRVPAWSDHQAKEVARDWQLDARPADQHSLHSETRHVKDVTPEDVPNDYDPYGSERLYEAIERAGDEDGGEV